MNKVPGLARRPALRRPEDDILLVMVAARRGPRIAHVKACDKAKEVTVTTATSVLPLGAVPIV